VAREKKSSIPSLAELLSSLKSFALLFYRYLSTSTNSQLPSDIASQAEVLPADSVTIEIDDLTDDQLMNHILKLQLDNAENTIESLLEEVVNT
jgi:hypothetical protein